MPNRELLYFLVCDFARVEEGTGKGIYIGAYGASILTEGFPAALPSLSFVACFRGLAEKEKLEVTIAIPGVEEHLSATQDVDTTGKPDLETSSIMITISPCVIPAAGEVSLEYRFEDGVSFHRSIGVKARTNPK